MKISTYTPRQIEILTLLSKYGVVSSLVIRELLNRSSTMNSVRETLCGMEKRNLICRVSLGVGGHPLTYWMLPDAESAKGRALAATGLAEHQFRNKRVRYSHAPHESVCTLVQASIERRLPGLLMFREATSGFKNLPDYLMSSRAKALGYTPDLCIGVPGVGANPESLGRGCRWIAVEVDRSSRSKTRIAQRMNVYTKHTAFAGLLYLVPSSRSVTSLREIYTTRGGKNVLRLEGSSDAFLATAQVPGKLFDPEIKTVFCGDHEVSLRHWLSIFARPELYERDLLIPEPFG